MRIQYRIQNNEIEIVRCFGNDPKIVLPGCIEGKHVHSVAAYAFSDRKGKEETDVLEFETADHFLVKGEERLFAGAGPEELVLPDTVWKIGNYAFYGCKNLERFSFSGSLTQLGSGAFTGCGKLRRLDVYMDQGGKSCVKEILGELWQRIDVTFLYETGARAQFVFPEHYEEAVENTPARILFTQHHGTGNHYRQCFYNKELDCRKYDELFPLAVAQDGVELLSDLAFCRLESGYELTVRSREMYEAYVRENLSQIVQYLLEHEKITWVELLSKRKLWSRTALDEAVEQAAALGKAEVVAYLMNERYKWSPEKTQKKRKRFEL